MNFYKENIALIEKFFDTHIHEGLDGRDAQNRIKKYGYNIVPPDKSITLFTTFINQFRNPLIYTLISAAIFIFIFGEDKLDAFIISGVLFLNSILGTIQEERTRTIVKNMHELVQTSVIVIRDGIKIVIDDKELVPGDIIILQEGQKVPADSRIIKVNNMHVDESILTGESGGREKNNETIVHTVALGDQSNMVFKGTYIMSGDARALVVATGKNSYIGKLSLSIEDIKTDIPLKRDLEQLAHWILIFILGICVLLFLIGFFIGKPVKELFVMLTALFICVVPEGLPVVLTLILTSGAYRMAKKNVLVKNMQAVEALGRTNVIIVDKTGTLTQNQMRVSSIITQDSVLLIDDEFFSSVYYNNSINNTSHNVSLLTTAITLLNTSELLFTDNSKQTYTVKGESTQTALLLFAHKVGIDKQLIQKEYTLLYDIPFSWQTRFHAAFFNHSNGIYCFIIGAPEIVNSFFNQKLNQATQSACTQLLESGSRTLCVAYFKLTHDYPFPLYFSHFSTQEKIHYFTHTLKKDVQLIGICGIEDTVRPEASTMIEKVKDAGIRVVMATGDHCKTALYFAKKVGICNMNNNICINGNQLDTLSDQTLLDTVATTTIFCRVTPTQKVRIVQAFQQTGAIVAMTGDGINDIPSLRVADLSIVMGNFGTEAVKQSADLILLDDSFSSIISAIEQGRHIFYTLKRVILYFFATNLAEILIVFFALTGELLYGQSFPIVLTAAQILWLNLITDGFLDIGLSMEPQEPYLLDKKWLNQKHTLIDSAMIFKIIWMAVPMASASLGMFLYYQNSNIMYARTMALMVMVMMQWFNAWNCRSMTQSLWHRGFFSNRWLLISCLIVLLLQGFLLYSPFMQHIFKTVPLSFKDWSIILAISFPVIIVEEIRKKIIAIFYCGN